MLKGGFEEWEDSEEEEEEVPKLSRRTSSALLDPKAVSGKDMTVCLPFCSRCLLQLGCGLSWSVANLSLGGQPPHAV